MPLGMMAKDSIQDFTLLGIEAEDKLAEIPHDKDENNANESDGDGGLEAIAKQGMESLSSIDNNNTNNKQQQAMMLTNSSNSDDATTSSAGSCCSAASPANPQQAQEEQANEDEAPRLPQRTTLEPSQSHQQQQQQQNQQYAGFKSDYWGQQYYNNHNMNTTNLPRNSMKSNSNNNTAASYAGAYDASYFYDPYATTSGMINSRSGGASSNNSSMYLLGRPQQEQQLSTFFRCLLPCIFPWLAQQQQGPSPPPPTLHHDAGLPLEKTQSAAESENETEATTATREKVDDDDVEAEEVASNASDALGEKLSDRERQAVLARLRLVQPEVEEEKKSGSEKSDIVGNHDITGPAATAATSSSSSEHRKQQQGLLPESPSPKPIKGILKRRTAMMTKGNQDALAVAAATAATATSSIGAPSSDGTGDGGAGGSKKTPPPPGPRRSLFPQYSYDSYGPPGDLGDAMALSTVGQLQRRTKRQATFAPMARVMTIKSKNDMTQEEKGDVWWVKSDYEDFRKAGRIISRAMVEGGSEIWLAFSRSCRAAAKKKKKAEQQKAKMNNKNSGNENEEKVCSDEDDDEDDDDGKDMQAITCDKWWHEFGHSRRGLEHVVSIEEGRQRQQNVRNAIQAVLEEQARQKLCRRQVDSDKLRKISLQYTSWARDLALASGSSDADAVKSSFADSRKSREFYLSELITSNNSSSASISSAAAKSTSAANTSATATAAVTIPDFMRASSLRQNSAVRQTIAAPTADLLDANTAAQIRYRRKKDKDAAADKKASSITATTTITSEEPVHDGPLSSISITISSSGGNIEDVVSTNKPESMAHRAAGFSAEGVTKINAAAVLSGMGAVPQSSNTVISTA